MPIYEYRCKTCEHEFAHLHPRYSSPAPPCPECGATELRKLLSTFSASVKAPEASCSLGKCPSGGSCQTRGTCPMG